MEKISSAEGSQKLVSILNTAYPIRVFSMRTHRDWIGHVYFVESADGTYVLKLYRPFLQNRHFTQFTLFNIWRRRVIRFLRSYAHPPGNPILVDTPDGRSVAIHIQATISECQGYSLHHLENQHGWLMR